MKVYKSLEDVRKDFVPNKPKGIFEPRPCPRCAPICMVYIPDWIGKGGYWECKACGYKEQEAK